MYVHEVFNYDEPWLKNDSISTKNAHFHIKYGWNSLNEDSSPSNKSLIAIIYHKLYIIHHINLLVTLFVY